MVPSCPHYPEREAYHDLELGADVLDVLLRQRLHIRVLGLQVEGGGWRVEG